MRFSVPARERCIVARSLSFREMTSSRVMAVAYARLATRRRDSTVREERREHRVRPPAWTLQIFTSFFPVPCPSQSLGDDAARSVDATDDGGRDTQPGRGCVGTRTADEAPVPLTMRETKGNLQPCQAHSCAKLTLPTVGRWLSTIATTRLSDDSERKLTRGCAKRAAGDRETWETRKQNRRQMTLGDTLRGAGIIPTQHLGQLE